jgi:chromosome segregation ATPase
MAEAPDNIVLAYLRRIDERVERLVDDMQDIKTRLTAAEEAIVGLNRRIDRIDLRLERIERRLELTPTA